MKKILLFLMVIVAGMMLPLQAQNSSYEDVVYLKNGTTIRGRIIEQVPDVSITIQTRKENVYYYKMDEIEKITRELSQLQEKNHFLPHPRIKNDSIPIKVRGYLGLVEIEGGFGFKKINRFSTSFINGYRVIPEFAFGIGIGTRLFISRLGMGNSLGFPFFLHLRSDCFTKKKASLYVSLNIGYNISIMRARNYIPEGILIEPSFGIGFKIRNNNRMNIGLVFPINRVKYYYDYYYYYPYPYEGDGKRMDGAITLKIGFSF